jgi:hypothetical protein
LKPTHKPVPTLARPAAASVGLLVTYEGNPAPGAVTGNAAHAAVERYIGTSGRSCPRRCQAGRRSGSRGRGYSPAGSTTDGTHVDLSQQLNLHVVGVFRAFPPTDPVSELVMSAAALPRRYRRRTSTWPASPAAATLTRVAARLRRDPRLARSRSPSSAIGYGRGFNEDSTGYWKPSG